MGNRFLELLQIAIGKRDRLSHTPTMEEWRGLFADSQKQSVVGIAFAGVERLPKEQWPPQALLFEWIGAAERIKQKNALLDRQCVKLQKRFAEAGIKTSILKGQGVARYYDVSSLRQPGDIDIYVDCGRERLFEIVDSIEFRGDRQSEDKNRKSLIRDWDYKHLHLDVFRDTEVEVHYRVEVLLNLWKNRKLQKWFAAHTEEIFGLTDSAEVTDKTDGATFVTPTVEFNRFYILLHIYRHFLYEGVGLRQLLDYYFVLLHTECTDNTYAIKALKQFGMWKFARGVMWVLQEAFGLEKEYMIGEPLESEGRFILSEVMAGGNFGHHDKRLSSDKRGKLQTVKKVVKHNAHLMRHYPAEIIWPPLWFVWHKWWKWSR